MDIIMKMEDAEMFKLFLNLQLDGWSLNTTGIDDECQH